MNNDYWFLIKLQYLGNGNVLVLFFLLYLSIFLFLLTFVKRYWQIKICDYNMYVRFTLCPLILMSVASKTKTKTYTTVVFGFVVALSALPTWASTTTLSVSSLSTVSPIESTQSNQDLSVLRAKLKERFSWVATEVTSLIQWTTDSSDSSHSSASVRTFDVSQWIWVSPAISRQDFFIDIADDPYKSYIIRLAAFGVLTVSAQKFYPQNYFRVNDFVSLLGRLYKKKFNQELPQDVCWWSGSGLMTKWLLQQCMYSLDAVQKVTVDGNPYDMLMRSEWAYYLVRMFDLPALVVEENSSFAVNAFDDIAEHTFASAINTLAILHIVNTQSSKFYPDNYLRHYDFTVLFVNSFLTAEAISLPMTSTLSFADVQSSSSYFPQLSYAVDRGLIDVLISSKRGALYFNPNAFMTKHEVYQILSKALSIQFVYDEQQADQERMSRGELAQLLVESFWFEPNIAEPAVYSTDWSADDVTLLNKLRVLLSMI